MPLGIAAQMSDEEAAALEALRDPNEEPLPGDDEPGADADQPHQESVSQEPPQAGAPKDGAVDATADDKQQAADAEKPKGNRNQALRAARIAEQRARQEAESLRTELETLRKQIPAGAKEPGADEDMTDEEIAELELDFPAAAKAARMAKRAAQAVAQMAPASKQEAAADTDFVPPSLPDELQAVVDEVPELLDWQHDPDQTRFDMAKATDGLLSRHPQWKDKPLEARFAEVVRRVNAELGATKALAANGRRDPQSVIDNAPMRTPKSVSEIGGGDGRNTSGPDVARFSRMSAEDVEAELMARGG